MPSLDLGGMRVAYADHGRGELVIALHCSGSTGAQWRRLAEALGGGYRVLAPDLLGYGGTDRWHGRRPISFGDEALIVGALLERCGGRAHLVGHSYGGAVALHAARLYGADVRSLAVFEPVAFHLLRGRGGDASAALAEVQGVADDVARSLASGDYLPGFGRFVDYWSGPGAWAVVAEDKRSVLANVLDAVALNFWAGLNEPTGAAHFAQVKVPALVLRGERSTRAGWQVAQSVVEALPRAELVTLEGAGHMAPLTHAAAVNGLLRAHLERHRFALDRPSRGERLEPLAA